MNEPNPNDPGLDASQNVNDTFGAATAPEGATSPDAGAGPDPGAAAPAAVDLSDATVQRLAGALAGSRAPAAPAPAPQMSQEQIDDLLKVVKINDPDLADALGLDEERTPKAAKFMRDLVSQIIRHVNVVSDVRQRMFTQQHLTPMQRFIEQQRNTEYERQFFDTYPDLKPHAKIARLVYKDMISQGARFNTPEEAYHAIAKATTALTGGGSAGSAQTSGTAGNGQAGQMSTIAMGGRASGAATDQAKQSNPVKDLFG